MLEIVTDFFTHIFDVPFVVQLFCFSAAVVLLVGTDKMKQKGNGILRFFLDAVCLAFSFLVLNLLFTVISGLFGICIISFFSYFTGIILYAVLRSPHSLANRFAMASVAFALTMLTSALGTLLGNSIKPHVSAFDVIFFTKIVSYGVVLGCAFALYCYPLFRFETNLFHSVLNITCNLLSAGLFVLFEYCRQGNRDFMVASNTLSGYISAVTVCLFCINIVTYFMTYYLCKERETVLEYRTQQQKGAQLKELLKLSEHKLTELREVRHDVKNQYAYMQVMLENGQYDELKRYFNELLGTFAKPLYECVNSGNEIVDSVLNLELAKAGENGVKMNTNVAVPPQLPFSKSGLLGIFTNVIDNAIEACVREKAVAASIDVTVSMQGDYLFFCVTNPTNRPDGELREDEPTCKADPAGHGYGMKIVRKNVKKYNGYYRNYVRNGLFFAECLLDMHYNGQRKK